jgi:hypothetical protein
MAVPWSCGEFAEKPGNGALRGIVVVHDLAYRVESFYIRAMMAERTGFTVAQVTRMTGVPYQTLNYWAKIGLVKPGVRDAAGSGSKRIYDFRDLVAVRVALKLRHAGVFGKALLPILKVLRQAGFESPATLAIEIAPGGEVLVTAQDGQLISARKCPGQILLDFSCDCTEAVREMQRLVVDLSSQTPTAPSRIATQRKPVMQVSAAARSESRKRRA